MLTKIYDQLYNEEEDARVCKDIPERACSNVPVNFFLNAFVMALGKLAEALANAKTTLPWLLSIIGAPGWTISLLVPIRESGSMLPQLAIGGWVRQFALRKWFYVGGAIGQAAALVGVALSVWQLQGLTAGIAVLGCTVVYSLARGFCSVASKDVIGKTVPKTRRGLASGLASAISGLGTLGVVLLFAMQPASEAHYIWLIVAGGLCWVAAAALGSFVEEQPGATEGGGNGIALALQRVSLLGRDVAFRRFVIGRALLMGTALTAPFIVLLARERSEAGLLFFLLAQGLAAMIGGPLCGIWADRSSRKLMLGMALAAGLLGLGVYLVDVFIPELTHTSWFLPATFFVLALIHDGVRMGRKTYLVDLGSGNKRTDYVAVSNTLIGVLLLFAGALASVVQAYGTVFAILMFSITAFCSIAFLWRIPEVQFDA